MVRVIIERRCRPDKEAEIENLLIELRTEAMQQRGFISGETLKSVDDPVFWLVVSTWADDEAWKAWENSPVRQRITDKMESLMFEPEKVSVFSFIRRGVSMSSHTIDR